MSNFTEKPMRSPLELVTMLRDDKGITFNGISEEDAIIYLSEHNNYLRTASYRKNYEKHTTGINAGKYIQLDFSYLIELSRLDMYLRSQLLQMCIDIEHALKVRIISDIELNPHENGYNIVKSFLKDNPSILRNIAQKADSIFTGNLIEKYFSLCYVFDSDGSFQPEVIRTDCPVWVLVELLTFKECISFFKYYNAKFPGRISFNFSRLNTIRSLRNACAHNNCLLISLRPGVTHPNQSVSQYISKIASIGKEERKNKLSCRPLYEIVCLLIEYNNTVSAPLKTYRMGDLKDFAHNRLVKNYKFFKDNQVIETAIKFFQKIIDNFQ